jgi:hypothetical protein
MSEPPVCDTRGGLAAVMSQAAAMLGSALSPEDAYAASGQAFVPCINTTQACSSVWAPRDRADGIELVCARAGIEARELDATQAAPDAQEDGDDPVSQQRIAAAKPFQLALETGGIVVGHNTWRASDDQAESQDAFGVVSDVTDAGDIHGLIAGDTEDMHIVWQGRNWVVHTAAARAVAVAVGRGTLESAAERIRTPRVGDRLFGLAAMDYWIDAEAHEVCGDRDSRCAAHYAAIVVEASHAAAEQLTPPRDVSPPSAAGDEMTRAARHYTRIAELLHPLTQGGADASRALLSEARDELSRAAEALESAGEA